MNTKAVNIKNSTWAFKLNANKNPSENIAELLKQLSIKKLKLFTKQPLKKKIGFKFSITELSMAGSVSYVDDQLLNIYKKLKKLLSNYHTSSESTINKKYELSLCRLMIHEAIITNHEEIEIDEKTNTIELVNLNTLESKQVTLQNIRNNKIISQEMNTHLLTRRKYLSLIDKHLSLFSEKINFDELIKTISPRKIENSKEMKLLEVWLALEHEGFIDNSYPPSEIVNKRILFFEIFDLKERNFNDRHEQIKNKKTLGDFLIHLSEKLRDKYQKNVTKKLIKI